MESKYIKEIAEIILSQLQANRPELWAWGSKNFVYRDYIIDDNHYPSLEFQIKTPKIKKGGRVIISLDQGSDSYIIEARRKFGEKDTLIGRRTDVYCNELHSVINSLIEDKETFYQMTV